MDAFERWRVDYEQKSERRATCAMVETIGDGRIDPAVRPVADLHDRLTGAFDKRPLA